MEGLIKALIKQPGRDAAEITIGNDLKSLQGAVGGYIEDVNMRGVPFVRIIVDEEGKLKRKQPNVALERDILVGTILVVGCQEDQEEFISLTEQQLSDAKAWLAERAIKGGV